MYCMCIDYDDLLTAAMVIQYISRNNCIVAILAIEYYALLRNGKNKYRVITITAHVYVAALVEKNYL